MINQRPVGLATRFPAAVSAVAVVELFPERENESKKRLNDCSDLELLEPATAKKVLSRS